MKAITYESYGPPSVLQLSDIDQPQPGDDDVLIRVRAAEATKADCEMRSFNFAVKWFWLPLRLAVGVFKPRRPVLGGYFSGEVAEVGKSVQGLAVGDSVFGSTGLHMGAYAEYVRLPSSATIVVKPNTMSYTDAAAVPLGGLNALHFMRLAKIEPGEQVLIMGAGGSIGAHAVQIAKSMGATVTGVDSGAKADMVRLLGADHVIDYTTADFTEGDVRYDAIFDMVPSSSYSACIKMLKPGGCYLAGNPRLSVMLRSVFTNWFTNKTARFRFAKESREELLTLKEMIESGKIEPIVDRVLPMDRVAEAHDLVETEQRLGAIVIAMPGAN